MPDAWLTPVNNDETPPPRKKKVNRRHVTKHHEGVWLREVPPRKQGVAAYKSRAEGCELRTATLNPLYVCSRILPAFRILQPLLHKVSSSNQERVQGVGLRDG